MDNKEKQIKELLEKVFPNQETPQKSLETGKMLKRFRLEILRMGLHRFAEWLGVKPSHICNVEHGRKFDDSITVEEINTNKIDKDQALALLADEPKCEKCGGSGKYNAGFHINPSISCPSCQPSEETEAGESKTIKTIMSSILISIAFLEEHNKYNDGSYECKNDDVEDVLIELHNSWVQLKDLLDRQQEKINSLRAENKKLNQIIKGEKDECLEK